MNKKKIIILGIIVLTIVMVTGVTFALWQITLKQETTNTLSISCFKITFEDKDNISLSNAYPIEDEDGKKLIPYTFTIRNTCDAYASFQVNLEVLNSTTLNNLDYIKVMLDQDINLLTENTEVEKTLSDANIAYKLDTGYLDANGSVTYTLRLWLDEDTPTDETFMNKVFQSKVTIITTYQMEFDYDKPIAVLNATKENGSLIIDASSSTDNTSIKNYYYSIDGENWISSKNNTHEFQEDRKIEYGIGTSAITSLYNSTIHKVYLKVEDEYGNMSEVVSTDFLDELEYDDTSDNNLRYIGSNPNNYVSFNNELWRIIGVMNNIEDGEGKKETRMKLIRDESIGEYSWDNKPMGVGSADSVYGSNDWSDSTMNQILNNLFYWSRSKGMCSSGNVGATKECDFSSNGMLEESKQYISTSVWNLGATAFVTKETYEAVEKLVSQIYLDERGNDRYHANKSLQWNGNIGLMYPSDYGYATSGGENASRIQCFQIPLIYWNQEASRDCYESNWLYNNKHQWTLTPLSSHTTGVSFLWFDGSVNGNNANVEKNISPVIYLKSSVKITNGLGTKEQPFELSL